PGGDADRQVGRREAVALGELVGAGAHRAGAAARGVLCGALPDEVAQPRGPAGGALGKTRGVGGSEVDDRVTEQREIGHRAGPAELDELLPPAGRRRTDDVGALLRDSTRGGTGRRDRTEGGTVGRRRGLGRAPAGLDRGGGVAAGRPTAAEERRRHSSTVGSGSLSGVEPRRRLAENCVVPGWVTGVPGRFSRAPA